jgi:hypothetical protein
MLEFDGVVMVVREGGNKQDWQLLDTFGRSAEHVDDGMPFSANSTSACSITLSNWMTPAKICAPSPRRSASIGPTDYPWESASRRTLPKK